MSSVVGGWLGVVAVLACASACVRDNWTYDAQVDVNTSEVTTDIPATDAAIDASVDTPATDVPATDVPTTDVPATDVPPIDVPPIDAPAIDVPAIDAPAIDVPATDAPAIDVPAIDVPPIDAPAIDVPPIDVPAADARADVSVDAPVADVPAGVVPRPIAPISLGDVTQRRPTLRWQLPAGFDGAVVDLCRDRACTMMIETRTVSGSSMQPTADLPARSVVFWRLRGRRGATTDAAYSPTWLFHVPATSASGGVDRSANPHVDVNGDGFDDVVVGAKWVAVRSVLQMGTVSVFHGSATGVAATAERVIQSPGTSGGESFGSSVAGAGDLNGDGYADLVVGTPGSDPRGLGQAGAVYVFPGSAAGVGSTPTQVLEGAARSNEFGFSVAGAGDVNGDGYADLVVGSPYAAAGALSNTGTASLFLGSAAGVASVAARVLQGGVADGYFGIAVAGAGDVNGDGYNDLVVGAPYAVTGGRSRAGTASVFLGNATGLETAAARVLEGVAADDNFGRAVARAGDLNGDGYDDLVVGASGASRGGLISAGTIHVFHGGASGVPAGATTVLTGADRVGLGVAVAGAGDVNGDGYDDLVVGTQSGLVSVFHGGAAGIGTDAARVLTGTDWTFPSVAGAGDVNGDGYDDLVVGTQNTGTREFNYVGSARVFQGSASGIPGVAVRVYEGAASGDAFGNAVASWCNGGCSGARGWCAWSLRGWVGRRRT